MEERAFGIDLSKWDCSYEDTVLYDFGKLEAHTERAEFGAARYGWDDYRDPHFAYHFKNFKRLKMGRIAYWGTSLWGDGKKDAERVLAGIERLGQSADLGISWLHDRLALDAELGEKLGKELITRYIEAFADFYKRTTGNKLIVYSRASWVNAYCYPERFAGDVDWWLAEYRWRVGKYAPEHSGPPTLPHGVKSYIIHQTGDKMPPIGSQQTYADYDRWNGGAEAAKAYFGLGEEDVKPVVKSIEERLSELEGRVDRLERGSKG